MDHDKHEQDDKKDFEPLEIMGLFWSAFGIVILIATFFVKATPRVPIMRGVITNIIAGVLLVGVGLFSIGKARANRRRQHVKS